MLRPTLALLALLAATPAAAVSASSAACNGDTAELVSDAQGTRLTVNGAPVALDPAARLEDLLCVSRDGTTLFGLTRLVSDTEQVYLLLDPRTRTLDEVPAADAAALGFFEDEDDWDLGSLGD